MRKLAPGHSSSQATPPWVTAVITRKPPLRPKTRAYFSAGLEKGNGRSLRAIVPDAGAAVEWAGLERNASSGHPVGWFSREPRRARARACRGSRLNGGHLARRNLAT